MIDRLREVLQDWEAVIGLEVHTELTTLESKMFCGCPIDFGGEPNSRTCPICLGLPGALPMPNKAAIESIVLAGLATGCDIEKKTMFYRKNYFYPDMAKNFQTTQGPLAFCMRGGINVDIEGDGARERIDLPEAETGAYEVFVGITRIHMEEDTGKMVHVGGADGRIAGASHSLVDYNRCGLPLIELVTEPDLRTPEEARRFVQKLRQIYLTLGISDVNMEEGSLRVDGNVSVRRRGTAEFGTKTELKNMNSFKNLHDGLVYEIIRQVEELEAGGTIYQETRHWEPVYKRTVVMRTKETADDYRLFPDPDLAPYHLTDEFIESVRARLPELPDAKKTRFMETWGLPAHDATVLTSDSDLATFFEAAVASGGSDRARAISNTILNDLSAHLNATGSTLVDVPVTPASIAELVGLVDDKAISSAQAKEVFAAMVESGDAPAAIVEARGMKQLSDEGELRGIVEGILEANPGQVEQYKAGKTGLLGFFVGQVMKATRGTANPGVVNKVLTEILGE